MAARDSGAKRLGPCALPVVLKSFLERFPDLAIASETHTSCVACGLQQSLPMQSLPCQTTETAGLTLSTNMATHPVAHCPWASKVRPVAVFLLLLQKLAVC